VPIQVLDAGALADHDEGKIAKWLKKEGDAVKSGDVIAEIETDKATMEFEAIDDGKMGRILVPEGTENVAVNAPSPKFSARMKNPALPQRKQRNPSPGREGLAAPPPAKPAAASAPTPKAAPAPEEMEWTGATVSLTVREALRDAMAEEMRRDDTVFLMGEEVAEYQGAYKVSQGLLEEFGARRVVRHPDLGARFHRPRCRCRVRRLAADRRVHDLELRHAGDGPAHQLRAKTRTCRAGKCHVRSCSAVPNGAARARRGAAQPGFIPAGTPMCRASR